MLFKNWHEWVTSNNIALYVCRLNLVFIVSTYLQLASLTNYWKKQLEKKVNSFVAQRQHLKYKYNCNYIFICRRKIFVVKFIFFVYWLCNFKVVSWMAFRRDDFFTQYIEFACTFLKKKSCWNEIVATFR